MSRDDARPKFLVTRHAVAAIERGKKRKGWNNVLLAEAVGISKQAVGDILALKEKRSAYLADMLRAVDEPDYLALDLTEEEIELLDVLRRAKSALSREQAAALVREFARDVEKEIALHEKTKRDE